MLRPAIRRPSEPMAILRDGFFAGIIGRSHVSGGCPWVAVPTYVHEGLLWNMGLLHVSEEGVTRRVRVRGDWLVIRSEICDASVRTLLAVYTHPHKANAHKAAEFMDNAMKRDCPETKSEVA